MLAAPFVLQNLEDSTFMEYASWSIHIYITIFGAIFSTIWFNSHIKNYLTLNAFLASLEQELEKLGKQLTYHHVYYLNFGYIVVYVGYIFYGFNYVVRLGLFRAIAFYFAYLHPSVIMFTVMLLCIIVNYSCLQGVSLLNEYLEEFDDEMMKSDINSKRKIGSIAAENVLMKISVVYEKCIIFINYFNAYYDPITLVILFTNILQIVFTVIFYFAKSNKLGMDKEIFLFLVLYINSKTLILCYLYHRLQEEVK